MIRWSLEKGFVTIPKSSNPKRIQENSEVFDFRLTEEDHELLVSFGMNEIFSGVLEWNEVKGHVTG